MSLMFVALCRLWKQKVPDKVESKRTTSIQEYEMPEIETTTTASVGYGIVNNTSDNTITSEIITTEKSMDEKEQETVSCEVLNTEVVTTTESILTQEHQLTTNMTEHQHKFVMDVSYVHHPEKGHYEDVCVAQGYSEEVYEFYDKYCYYCGEIMDSWSFVDIMDHSAIHGAYGTYQKVVETIWHEPEYEERWIVDQEAYDEEVITEICDLCGYVK